MEPYAASSDGVKVGASNALRPRPLDPYTLPVAACPMCGERNADSAAYCGSCGAALLAVGEGEERKVVTILFCDIVGFTARFDRADPEDVGQLLSAYHERVRREIERFDGTVEKFIGDAVMAVYGAPVTHEDDAERAVFTATRILSTIQELNDSSLRDPLAVRIGIATGEAVVSVSVARTDRGIAIGDVVNTASRLQAVAPAGGIVVGETTYRLTRDRFDYEPLEPVKVKGKAAPLAIWSVRSAPGRFGAQVEARASTPLVDRRDELGRLTSTLAAVIRERSVRLVTVVGEPGVGKSRMLLELFRHVDELVELVFWRQGRCLPFGRGVSFSAIAGIIKAHAGILESDGVLEAGTKLTASVAASVEEPAEREWIRARLAPLIGLDEPPTGDMTRTEAFSAWGRFFEAIAGVHPLVMVLEDIHWADAPLLDFVEYLVDRSRRVPILVLCTARPELYERFPRWRTSGITNTVALAPLSDGDTDRLLTSLFPAWISSDMRRTIVERSGGNALFAEEFARMLSDKGALADEASAADAFASLGSPETLHVIIAARVDALRASEKALLQNASVLGKVFWPGALIGLGGSDETEIRAALQELTRKEFVRPARDSSVTNEVEYVFSHALVRDVAYGQIPRLPRARKHIAAARWIEQLAGERVSESAELIAYHYAVALDLTRSAGITEGVPELEEAARRQWVIAGERAMWLDISRAEHCFDEALRSMPPSHADRPRVLARKAEVGLAAGRFVEAERTFELAAAGYADAHDDIGRGACLDRLATVLWERGDERWRARLADAVQTLEGQPPTPELADCYASVTSDHLIGCRFDEAIVWADRAIALAEEVGVERLIPRPLSYRGAARACLGDLDGFDDLERALAIAERIGLSRAHVQVLFIMAELEWAIEGPATALSLASAGIELAERRGVLDEATACRTLALGPLFDLGKWDEVEASSSEVVRWSTSVGENYTAVIAQTWHAQVDLWRGKRAEAVALADDAIARARRIRDPQVLVPAVTIAGIIAAIEGAADKAIALVEEMDRTTEGFVGWYREQYLADLVRVCVLAGRPDLAQGQLDRAHTFARRHVLSYDTARATVLEARGEPGEALGLYQAVARGWAEIGQVLEAAFAWLGAARCLGMTGVAGAKDHVRRAQEVFETTGAVLLRERGDELLAPPEARRA